MVGSSFAYFTDVEISNNNIVIAGTMDLKISDRNEPFQDGVSGTWCMTNMVPGTTTVGPFAVNLQNSGTTEANHVEIIFSHTIDETANPVEPDNDPISTPVKMARWIEIIRMEYEGVDFVADFYNNVPAHDTNGNGFLDLEDVTLPPYSGDGGLLDNLMGVPPPNNCGTTSLTMKLKFNAGATNDIQGDILNTTVYFVLNQDASQ